VLIAAALALGAGFGFGGNFLPPTPQIVAHALSSVGLAVGCLTLALAFAPQRRELVSAGLLVLAMCEIVMWNNGPQGDFSDAAVADAFMFFTPALLLISIPRGFPMWSRIAGFLFLIGDPPSESSPYAIVGYTLLTIAVIGWIVTVVRPVAGRGTA
jgi:hypothetical protein